MKGNDKLNEYAFEEAFTERIVTVGNDIEDHYTEDDISEEVITVENDIEDHFTEHQDTI